jgi:hypothetical protein
VTRVVRRSAPTKVLLEVVGSGAALSPSGSLVAWVAPSTMNRVPLGIKEVATGRELPITGLGEWLPTGATFGSDDATLFVVVSRASDATRNDILRLTRTGDGFAVQGIVAPTAGFKGVPVAIPGGRFLVYPIPSGNPVRLPVGLAYAGRSELRDRRPAGQHGAASKVPPPSRPTPMMAPSRGTSWCRKRRHGRG